MGKNMEQLAIEMLGFTRNTFYVWKRQKRPIISLLEYIGEERLNEFLKHNRIDAFEHGTSSYPYINPELIKIVNKLIDKRLEENEKEFSKTNKRKRV